MRKFVDFFKYLISERRWGLLALTILFMIASVSFSIWLTVWIIESIISFLASKFDLIITLFAVALVVIYLFEGKKQEHSTAQEAQQQAEQEHQRALLAAESEALRLRAENNYNIIRQCMFQVLQEKAEVLGLVKPITLSDLDSPCHIIHREGFCLCQFVAMKKEQELDLILVKELLQLRLQQKLLAFEFPAFKVATHIYNGYSYPILYIDEIYNAGGYIQLNLAIVNDRFCEYLLAKNMAKNDFNNHSQKPPFDNDF